MPKQLRNTEKIVRLAKEKSERTKVNVEKVISKMALEGKTINFNTVANESNVSKSWLYKEESIRQRIVELRDCQINSLSQSTKKRKRSLKSEEVLIKTLKVRIKELERENTHLKKQVEQLYGEVYSKS
ncbi:transposase [Bacillus cereus]|uniref:DUF6262 family protein n=1 Tax=Bacillus wiedmannii TaxID=1890302 RepID=A0AA95LV90_9BACI|nr:MULTISPECIES: DUF6262 family protein [Bacillus cereus group]ONH00747.1 transposase [Bacillus cereus]PEW92367.1 transposase [Bacillus thuringiensis]WHY28328.1 DUF6262 family protein [Bacillus wiedmannii]